MARGLQPTPDQLADEHQMTLQSATDELCHLDIPEARLIDFLVAAPEVQANPALARIAAYLQRSNRIEDADHVELYDAVRAS